MARDSVPISCCVICLSLALLPSSRSVNTTWGKHCAHQIPELLTVLVSRSPKQWWITKFSDVLHLFQDGVLLSLHFTFTDLTTSTVKLILLSVLLQIFCIFLSICYFPVQWAGILLMVLSCTNVLTICFTPGKRFAADPQYIHFIFLLLG